MMKFVFKKFLVEISTVFMLVLNKELKRNVGIIIYSCLRNKCISRRHERVTCAQMSAK